MSSVITVISKKGYFSVIHSDCPACRFFGEGHPGSCVQSIAVVGNAPNPPSTRQCMAMIKNSTLLVHFDPTLKPRGISMEKRGMCMCGRYKDKPLICQN